MCSGHWKAQPVCYTRVAHLLNLVVLGKFHQCLWVFSSPGSKFWLLLPFLMDLCHTGPRLPGQPPAPTRGSCQPCCQHIPFNINYTSNSNFLETHSPIRDTWVEGGQVPTFPGLPSSSSTSGYFSFPQGPLSICISA